MQWRHPIMSGHRMAFDGACLPQGGDRSGLSGSGQDLNIGIPLSLRYRLLHQNLSEKLALALWLWALPSNWPS